MDTVTVVEERVSTWLDAARVIGPVTWHWQRWLAPGFLHMVAAQSGLGKSSLALRLAGCYLVGWPWPDGTDFTGERGSVLWLESEGAQALNTQRAGKWGLPLDRIVSPFADPLEDVNLLSAKHRTAIHEAACRSEIRLIVLDSLSGARAGTDENDSRGLQSMKWLAGLARDTGKPIIATHHLRKRSILDSADEVNLDRLRGSSALVQVARLVWALDIPDAGQPGMLRLHVIKSNLERFPSPLGMRIDEVGRIQFTEAPEQPRKLSEIEQAAEFLADLLRNGPVRSTDVLSEADAMGLNAKTVRRAKEALRIEAHQANGCWWWRLPATERITE